METSRQTGSAPVAAAAGDTGVLDVVDEVFENIYDVPFIVVNKIDGLIEAEVEASASEMVTTDRIQEAQEVARRHGQRLWAQTVADIEYPELEGIYFGTITLYFKPDTDGDL